MTLLRWLNWEPIGAGPYETVRARAMWRTLAVLFPMVALQAVVPALAGTPARGLAVVPFLAQYAAALWFVRRGSQRAAALLVLGGGVLSVGVLLVLFGGIQGITAQYCGLGAILAVLWLDGWARWGIVAAFISLLPLSTLSARWVVAPFGAGDDLRLAELLAGLLNMGLVGAFVGTTVDALHAVGEDAARRADQADRARAAANAADEAKGRFLATISHELRTPLNAILGYAEILREEQVMAELDAIGAAGRRMLALVGELLEAARAERDTDPGRDRVDVRQVVQEQRAALALVTVTTPALEIRGQGPEGLTTDRARIGRAVWNLLSHTTRRGPGVVEIGPDKIVFSSAESGPAALRPFVLSTDGRGLEVALAEQFARVIGGRVEATDDLQTVVLWLPEPK
ncbi:MAG: HAMP domain-containing sensor histidine kinase [Myxococcota bacterium]